ncbi:MAG: adenosylcobinamide-GDP ribazoletransferase, partial [Candidatus Omnitrophica bacterium]|nr:adenosylcobinamide-GDP ribazoletransferase [Candidatus Omnitrophota bacterium]
MKNFFIALQFLTIIPIRIKRLDDKNLSRSVIYFPLIGLFLGLLLAGINNLLTILNLSDLTVNIILIFLLIVMTGGLHLDGLADTFDGVMSGKNKDETLAIMRDPHIGVMGVLSLIIILSLKVAFLSSVSASLKTVSLLLMGVLSRWSMVFAMSLFPYARQDGKAKKFITGADSKIIFPATAIALICAITIGRL